MARRGNFWLGILVGAVAGAVTALLYAPKKGDELRHDIGDSAREVGRKAGQAWSDAKDRTSEMASGVRERVQQVAGRGREFVETGRTRLREAVHVGREAAEERRRELQEELEPQE